MTDYAIYPLQNAKLRFRVNGDGSLSLDTNSDAADSDRIAFANRSDTVAGTAESLTDFGFSAAQVQQATSMLISVYTQNIRYWLNSVNPTAAVGHQIAAGGERVVNGAGNLSGFRMIAETGTATVAITLFA